MFKKLKKLLLYLQQYILMTNIGNLDTKNH